MWTTDKDGIILALLGLGDPRGHRASPRASTTRELTAKYGDPAYARIDAPATREEKAGWRPSPPTHVDRRRRLAGEPITAKLTAAPGNGATIGGLKVTTESAWFAARPSGTEDVYKIYAESFRGPEHLAQVQAEAREVVVGRPDRLTAVRGVGPRSGRPCDRSQDGAGPARGAAAAR